MVLTLTITRNSTSKEETLTTQVFAIFALSFAEAERRAGCRMIDWAREIRRYRETAGLLQGALAERLCVTQATVSRWESGRQRPDLASQQRLRPLLWNNVLSSDALLLHTVTHSPASSSLCDRKGRLLAASQSIVRSFGFQVSPNERLAFDMERVSPSGYEMFQTASTAGLFGGDIASLTFRGLVNTCASTMVCDEIWYPVRLNDGEMIMRADVELRDAENDEELRRLAEPPTPEIVGMEELARLGPRI